MYQTNGIDGRFMRRPKTCYQGFEDSAADPITQANGNTETKYHQQDRLPVAAFPNQQNQQ